MKVTYNKKTETVIYTHSQIVDCFTLKCEIAYQICPALKDVEALGNSLKSIEIDRSVFDSLCEAHVANLYKVVDGYSVRSDAPIELVLTAIEADKLGLPVLVEYDELFANYTGLFSAERGCVVSCWINSTDSSTDNKKLIRMDEVRSNEIEIFSFDGVKSIQIIV